VISRRFAAEELCIEARNRLYGWLSGVKGTLQEGVSFVSLCVLGCLPCSGYVAY
jgi:hypothetical protein